MQLSHLVSQKSSVSHAVTLEKANDPIKPQHSFEGAINEEAVDLTLDASDSEADVASHISDSMQHGRDHHEVQRSGKTSLSIICAWSAMRILTGMAPKM